MITNPRSGDGKYIDIPPANKHGWINRAAALTRWAMNRENNRSLTAMLKIQIRAAIERAR